MPVSKNLELPQGHIAYLQNEFNPNRPTVLALHGWLDNAASFLPLMSALPQYNWTAIDLPGHGHSFHRPPYSHYHFIDWLTDLVAFHRALYGDSKIHIVGHSLGGMLATTLAGLYPEIVDKLILIDAVGLVTQDEKEPAKHMRKALDSRERWHSNQNRSHPSMESAIQARMAAGKLTLEGAKMLVERNIRQTQSGFEWRTDPRLKAASPVRINQMAARDVIRQIQSPTLVCLAKQGYPSMQENLDTFQSDYTKLQLEWVEGGHHCHMDAPHSTAKAISRFL